METEGHPVYLHDAFLHQLTTDDFNKYQCTSHYEYLLLTIALQNGQSILILFGKFKNDSHSQRH